MAKSRTPTVVAAAIVCAWGLTGCKAGNIYAAAGGGASGSPGASAGGQTTGTGGKQAGGDGQTTGSGGKQVGGDGQNQGIPGLFGVNLAGADFGESNLPGSFGTHYTYPTSDEVAYFVGRGFNTFRLPFRWERLQRTLFGDFDDAELDRLQTLVDAILGHGAWVILDPHNYARYHDEVIGAPGSSVSADAFADFWSRLAARFHQPRVIYGLMNEPHSMSGELWLADANAAIAAIRATGAANLILVPGNAWTGAHSWHHDWYGTPNAELMLDIVDPAENVAFETHQYLNSDSSGRSIECISQTVGSERLQAFTDWLAQHQQRGFLGEFAGADNATCAAALHDMLDHIDANRDVWLGWTYWAAGPWWGDSEYSIEPRDGQDDPRLSILQAHTGDASTGTAGSSGGGGATGTAGGSGGGGATGTAGSSGVGGTTGTGGSSGGGGATGAGGDSGTVWPPASGCDCQPLQVTRDADVDGFKSNDYAWYDRACQPRRAALVHNDQQDPEDKWGGYMRRYAYQVDGQTRVCVGDNSRHPGFGMLINHYDSSAAGSHRHQGTGYRVLLDGPHHAIQEFTWRYPIDGHDVDVTVHWMFATGRDHPIWAVTFDTSGAPANAVRADTRSPYGDIQWDGGVHADVDGVAWGDRYKFRSLSSPVTLQSGWDYTEPNTVPYAMEWSAAADAQMGLVQTQTYLQHDAGGYWFYTAWGTQDADGPMPDDWNWTYQLNQYELPWGSKSKRLAWGSNYGAVGYTSYNVYGDDAAAAGYPFQSYSVFIVLGQHSHDTVAQQVAQVETAQGVSLTARVGTPLTTGPAGVGRSDTMPYEPVGYNPIYATWEVAAHNNAVDLEFAVPQGTLTNPVLVLHDWNTDSPCEITVDGQATECDGFVATRDRAAQRLWLTLVGELSGNHRVEINGANGCGD